MDLDLSEPTRPEDAEFDAAMNGDAPETTPPQNPSDEPENEPAEPDDEPEPEKPVAAKPDTSQDDPAALKRELERMSRQIQELTESERYWASRAKGDKHEAPPEDPIAALLPKPKPVKFETPEALVEALSTRGEAALDELIASRGYVRQEDVIRIARAAAAEASKQEVASARKEITLESQIQRDFPDLFDSKSALFEETRNQMRELSAADPAFAKSPAALLAAARTAKAVLGAKAPAKPDAEAEKERRARARAQSGSTTRRAPADDDGDPALSQEALFIAKSLGVSAADYRASLKGNRYSKRGIQ